MPLHRPNRPHVAALALLCGCNVDKLVTEFHLTDPPVATTTADTSSSSAASDESSTTDASSSSSSASSTTRVDDSTSSGGSTAHHTSESSTTTDAPPSVCGDGLVDGDEECDDGNDDDLDACDNTCAAAWTLFVASGTTFTGAVNGLEGADSRCANRAGNAPLPRHLSYRALLSDSTTDAADRLHHARGWYRLVNGLPVAHGWDALMNEPLLNPINVTEKSETHNTGVWTGTLPGGIAVKDAEHCADWTSNSPLLQGHWGRSGVVDAGWLQSPYPETNPTTCTAPQTIYCIEQP